MELSEKSNLLVLRNTNISSHQDLTWYQIIFTIIVMIPTIACGMTVGMPAIALPQLDNLTTDESAWFSSLASLSAIISVILCGVVMDKYGRKFLLLYTPIMASIGFVFTFYSSSLPLLFIGQFLCGLAQGSAILPASVYVAESIAPHNLKQRNSLTSWISLAINIGICLVYWLGPFMHFTTVAGVGLILSLVSIIIIIIFIPESPAWLHQKGRFADATIAKIQLKCNEKPGESMNEKQSLCEEFTSFAEYIVKMKRKDVYKPLIITTTFVFLLQFSGQMTYTAHMVDIIEVKNIEVDAYDMNMVCGFIVIISQILCINALPYMGIKKVAIISALMTGFASATLGVTIVCNDNDWQYSKIVDYIHIGSVWLFNLFSSSLCTVPFTVISEIFPADARGFGAIPSTFNSIFYFVVLLVYSYSLSWSTYLIYLFFASFSLITAFFVHIYVPETVGKSLDEINDLFKID